jgi:hypothetical protein
VPAETYRRLPGRRRGITGNASLWMGSDHILLVRSSWFREEYKRFYLRDIQAIVVAPGPRFNVSLPGLIFALLWLLPGMGAFFWPAGVVVVWALGALTMAVTWLAISLASGCRTRLYTAVSQDDLPSLYRTWTARKFLNRVKPFIDQVQGVVAPDWTELERTGANPLAAAPGVPAAPAWVPSTARSHTPASDLFVLSLLAGAMADFAVLHFNSAAGSRIRMVLTLLQLVGAVVVLVEHHRGKLRRAMQRVAIAALVLMGVMFYVQSFSFSLMGAAMAGNVASGAEFLAPPVVVIHQIAGGIRLLLVFVGVAVMLRSGYRDQPDIIKD